MKVEIKRVHGNEYLQIVDERGFLHHVGVLDIQNLAVRQYFVGRREWLRHNREREKQVLWLEEKLLALGYPLSSEENESVEHLAMALQRYYDDGNNVFVLKNRSGILAHVNKRIEDIERRIFVFELLENKIMEEAESKGVALNRQTLKKIVKNKYRNISEEEKEQLINEYDELLFSAVRKRLSK
jgi:hypothetical protein